jgi:hypothetical protein
MARYLILIHGNESRWGSMSDAEREQIDGAHRTFRERAGDAVIASGELQPSAAAATVRDIADGVPVVTAGPYAESEEVVGGFYLISAADREEAVSLAAGLAEVTHDHSWVEVWPLVDHEEG